MFHMLLSILVGLVVLVIAESLLRSKRKVNPELSRKLVHIAHGVAAATWPFFVSYKAIVVVEVIFLVQVYLARRYRWFKGLNNIKRRTWGEYMFPLGVIVAALLQPPTWVFVAAMLHLGLADAIAAIVGTTLKKPHRYKVFGHTKSVEGTFAFVCVSIIIMSWAVVGNLSLQDATAIGLVMSGSLLAAMLENIGWYGVDNLFVPAYITVLLGAI